MEAGGQGLQSNPCVRALPERSGRDTVCAVERSTFRKRLCGERVEVILQGYQRRRYICPICGGELILWSRLDKRKYDDILSQTQIKAL